MVLDFFSMEQISVDLFFFLGWGWLIRGWQNGALMLLIDVMPFSN